MLKRLLVTSLIFACLSVSSLSAMELIKSDAPFNERWKLKINGLTHHFSSDSDVNECNYGLGFAYSLGELDCKWALFDGLKTAVEVDAYNDSYEDLGYSIGVAFQKPLTDKLPLDWGLHVGLIHEDHLAKKSGLFLHPYVFPYLETTFHFPVNARVLAFPPVHNDGIIALQLIVKF